MTKKQFRCTKIVCTIGPASASVDVLGKMIKTGMDVARLNCSHGNHQERGKIITTIRRLAKKAGRRVGILLDLQGPKLRIGEMTGEIILRRGDEVRLIPAARASDCGEDGQEIPSIPINYDGLLRDVSSGDPVLLDEGLIRLRIREVRGNCVICVVLVGGVVRSRKGFYLPSSPLSVSSLTEKDREDLAWGLSAGVDMVALSFVRNARDIEVLKEMITAKGAALPIVAKIERKEALKNIEKIVETADAVMVARGDMGVEVPIEYVSLHQKRIIEAANKRGKPVITATQMLDSMERNPRPTRAEVSDVTNAILDGTDAIMLSGETAAGKYPVKSLRMMVNICRVAEKYIRDDSESRLTLTDETKDIAGAVSHAAVILSETLGVKAIVTATISGYTARMVARHRPRCPILALTTEQSTAQALTLCWGVRAIISPRVSSERVLFKAAEEEACLSGMAKSGDTLLVTAGLPFEKQGITNTIKVVELSQ